VGPNRGPRAPWRLDPDVRRKAFRTPKDAHVVPFFAFGLLVLVAGYIILFALLRRAHRRLNNQQTVLSEAAVYRALVEQAGLGGRWPHSSPNDATGAPWADLCKEVLRSENRILYILGANGEETFGAPEAPLYGTLEQFHGTVRIVLLYPDSDQMAGRAAAVGMTRAQ
jgi:hypothetical protein